MKSSIRPFLLMLLMAAFTIPTAVAQKARAWNLDKSHASVNFSIDHFFTAVTGKFKKFDGTFHFDPKNLSGSSATFTIQVASVDTDEEDRDEHLQSEDFFNASKYPTIKFVSTKFEKKSDKEYTVTGNMTMRGTTKEISFPLKVKGVMDNPWKDGYEILGIEINTALDRTDFGVGTGSWAATSVVADEVDIHISMELDSEK